MPVVPTSVARIALRSLLRRLRHGSLRVVERGRAEQFGDDDGPGGEVRILDEGTWKLVFRRGSTGLGEAYIDGRFETDDPVALLRVMVLNVDRLNRLGNRFAGARNLLARPFDARRRSTAIEARQNVVAHYDVGDDFFELFLDPSMAYSCGVFEHDGATLEEASIAKFERLCKKLDLTAESRLVEIGSGWGGFAVHAARTRGCHVSTTTISEQQFHAARRRVQDAGLEHLVDVVDRDFRDLEGSFTHLVSIEMIEALDWRDYDAYFSTIDRLLEPGGRAVLQCILIGDDDFERAKRHDDFLRNYVFPGGCLPSRAAISAAAWGVSSLAVVDHEDLGPHYVRTLQEWRRRLESHWTDAMSLGYDERFLRMWRFYLAYCEAGFAERHVSVAQLVFERQSRP